MSLENLKQSGACRTVAAQLTPPGRGALAIVEVYGPGALHLVASLCFSKSLSKVAFERWSAPLVPAKLWVCRWRGPAGEPVVVRVKRADQVEISCHGGAMPVQTILCDLADRGVATISWMELLRIERTPIIEREAMEVLARASTLRTARILLDQYHGALTQHVARLRQRLNELSRNTCRAVHSTELALVAQELTQLLDRSAVGLHLVEPWRVAIVGRPNVGKSSLLNALVGYDRAIVHPTGGTTRDLVTATTAIDGWPVELSDSAGIRSLADELEAAGIRRARDAITQSDWQFVVLDCSQPVSSEDRCILRLCPRPIVIANKIDLARAWDHTSYFPGSCAVSAMTAAGIDELAAQLATRLVPSPPAEAEAVPFTARQVGLLRAAEESTRAGEPVRTSEVLGELLGEKAEQTFARECS